jgi:Zn-dependent peptidase ImmA (M78 family)/transcriptional regulator with XRE-family HTH domain
VLAKRIGVSQSNIAAIETGRAGGSAAIIDAIAMGTQFPPSFLRQDSFEDFPRGSHLLFRARSSASARKANQAHRYAQVAFEFFLKLSEGVKEIPLRLPQIPDETPEDAAQLTRSQLGLSPDTPIGNLTRAVEEAGVILLAIPLSLGAKIDAFSAWPQSRPVISLLSQDAGDRLRFTLAHELGHLVMHHSLHDSIPKIEKEANRFAGALLIPEQAFREEFNPTITVSALSSMKRRWKMSMAAMVMRANDLRVVTERQKRYFFQRFSGMRKNEPIAIPAERPRALRQMAERKYGDPPDLDRLVRDVSLPHGLVQDILSVHRGGPAPRAQVPNVLPFPST